MAKEKVSVPNTFGTDTDTELPYSPQENGIAERLNRTLLNGARCIIATAQIQEAYWPFAVTDIVFKQGLLPHSPTRKCPFSEWTRTNVQLPRMFTLGQMGHMPKLPLGTKLKTRAVPVRYMGMADLRRATVQLSDGTLKQCRRRDFHRIRTASDTTANKNIAFRTFTDKLGFIRTNI